MSNLRWEFVTWINLAVDRPATQRHLPSRWVHRPDGTRTRQYLGERRPRSLIPGIARSPAVQRSASAGSRPQCGRSEQKKFYHVTFSRSYLDEEKRFHDANSFGRDDLPLVAKLADEAHTFIFKRLASQKSEEQGK